VNTPIRPFGVKSAWSMPAQFGVSVSPCTCQVFGSYQTSRRRASATTMADLPSGE